MTDDHRAIREKIFSSGRSQEEINRGMVYSMVETIRDILIAKGIVSEIEYTKQLDIALIRNFQIKE
ncbi:MAG: hypothetical protein COU30_00175 [Candidatus Magasanikbacteria bacterium CG10_big_fil_rev_8_21_14_0_10_38_6]|uniref:Uncharacterized protein n=1 Tax=Candidatus Magasanikbacteria bacterium CG10_big_fil_rev_8_21_14_0_10_38_6 TaxID=1974647 RepID=A0A2M6P2E1_9BACT|nr:MAG: hypothetical protein COU30_00175 [Candidatus Magasanikbacteria bacterium CG10_big_fil_rev_8_21_14_0_10_38_6]